MKIYFSIMHTNMNFYTILNIIYSIAYWLIKIHTYINSNQRIGKWIAPCNFKPYSKGVEKFDEGYRFYSQQSDEVEVDDEDEHPGAGQSESVSISEVKQMSVLKQFRLAVRELRRDSSALDVLFRLTGAYVYNIEEPTKAKSKIQWCTYTVLSFI